MNTLKIECMKNDYVINEVPKADSENEIAVEIPEDWDCEFANILLWEDDICEIFEKNDEMILLVPQCGELLLERVKENDDVKQICVPKRYENLDVLILKV